ncbi:MAG: hypothetical protein Q9N34_10450 [Aquificota bacterium]|nr:hypothetical protein [Aquificota bacterium]
MNTSGKGFLKRFRSLDFYRKHFKRLIDVERKAQMEEHLAEIRRLSVGKGRRGEGHCSV